MKTARFAFGLLLPFSLLPAHPVAASPISTNPAPYRLAIDLRDGSRVIGESSNPGQPA